MHQKARSPNELEQFFVKRANAGDLDGLLALYEHDAVLVNDQGEIARGYGEIRAMLKDFLAEQSELEPGVQAPAICSGNLALTSSVVANGDVTAEIARRQADGSWLWVVDHFAIASSLKK